MVALPGWHPYWLLGRSWCFSDNSTKSSAMHEDRTFPMVSSNAIGL